MPKDLSVKGEYHGKRKKFCDQGSESFRRQRDMKDQERKEEPGKKSEKKASADKEEEMTLPR